MKSLLSIVLLYVTFNLCAFAQDVVVTLPGATSAQGFSVKDNINNTLMRITGAGNVGINNVNPLGIFEVLGGVSTEGDGRGISITAESTEDFDVNGGDIFLQGGYVVNGLPAEILIGGGTSGMIGGDLNLFSGEGETAGHINIIAGDGYTDDGGNINILSGDGLHSGNINIETNSSNMWSGNITIKTGEQNAGAGKIEITTTGGTNEGSDILLQAGINSDIGGEDIILAPNPDGGLVIVNGSGTYSGTWTQSSDKIFKKNIQPLKNTIDKIEQLNGVSYELKKEEFPKKNFTGDRQIGLIAQDVEKVFPELVKTDNEGYKSVAYQNMVAVLIEAVKEQQKSIDQLKKEVELLKSSAGNNNVEVSSLGN